MGARKRISTPPTTSTRPPSSLPRMSNAYMLVYVRESDWAKIMGPISRDEIPSVVHDRQEVPPTSAIINTCRISGSWSGQPNCGGHLARVRACADVMLH